MARENVRYRCTSKYRGMPNWAPSQVVHKRQHYNLPLCGGYLPVHRTCQRTTSIQQTSAMAPLPRTKTRPKRSTMFKGRKSTRIYDRRFHAIRLKLGYPGHYHVRRTECWRRLQFSRHPHPHDISSFISPPRGHHHRHASVGHFLPIVAPSCPDEIWTH